MIGFYVLIALVVLALLFAKMAIVIIPQSETRIIERLGRYYATLKPGINIIIPFIDKAKVIVTYQRGRYTYSNHIDLREQVYDFDKQNVITKDNIQMQINALLYFQIVDPFKAVYEINNLPNAIEKLTQTTLRNIIGEMELDQTLTSREIINTKMRSALDMATDPWGIKVNRVELKNIMPPAAIQEAMEKQMKAERERREAILIAEGEKKSTVLVAEGKKESAILDAEAEKQAAILRAEAQKEKMIREAEGEAEAILKVQQANADGIKMLKEAGADAAVLKLKSLEAFEKVADGQATTILLPAELQGIASIAETFKAAAGKKQNKSHTE